MHVRPLVIGTFDIRTFSHPGAFSAASSPRSAVSLLPVCFGRVPVLPMFVPSCFFALSSEFVALNLPFKGHWSRQEGNVLHNVLSFNGAQLNCRSEGICAVPSATGALYNRPLKFNGLRRPQADLSLVLTPTSKNQIFAIK